jgi:L-ribulose-5-phosphate 4-epimerase
MSGGFPQGVREQVALACAVLGLEDHGDLVWGHASLRDPDGRGVWMKASTWGFEEITEQRVVLVGWDGQVLEGDGRRHAEYPIHTEIMRARPDVNSVVHTHAPHSVAFAATGQPLRPISHEATFFVPPEIARFTETGDLILTEELGRSVADSLGDRNAMLLVHHGIVTAGPDIPTAVLAAILLERACEKQLLAMSAAELATWSSDEEALAKREHCYPPPLIRHAWDYLVRRLRDRGGS